MRSMTHDDDRPHALDLLVAQKKRIADLERAIRGAIAAFEHIRGEAVSLRPDAERIDAAATSIRDELRRCVAHKD